MMLSLYLLGKPIVKHDEQVLGKVGPKKFQALLFYLAINQQKQTREYLATSLWSAKNARNGLAGAIFNAKKTPASNYVNDDKEFLWIDKKNCSVDAVQLIQASKKLDAYSTEDLITIGSFYRGPFLDGFHLPDRDGSTEVFVAWVSAQRALMEQAALLLFDELVRRLKNNDLYADAIEWIEKQLKINPYREDLHREKMLALQAIDHHQGVISYYHSLPAQLELDEADFEPATKKLYEESTKKGAKSQKQIVRPFQAPRLPTHFIGRNQTLSTLATDLTTSDAPCHAVVGMGGIGKTTLATAIAHELREYFVDGVLWANSADSDGLASVLQHWGRLYGRDWSATDVRTLAPLFRDLIADKKVLVVLDDVTGDDEIRPILPSTNSSVLLITTRDRNVAYEHNANLLNLEILTDQQSLDLLTNIIDDDRPQNEIEAAKTICQQLENLPLAIEIIAQRIRAHKRTTIQRVADDLADIRSKLDQLELGNRAVRASIELSWKLLDDRQKSTFTSLGLFNGRSFGSPAIAHIHESAVPTTERILNSLLNLSLLSFSGETHYRQHALLADFANEIAITNAQTHQEAQIRFIDYYDQFAEENQRNYAVLRPEWVNLQQAIQLADQNQHWPTVLKMGMALEYAWFARARYTNARQTYPLIQNAAAQLENLEKLAHTNIQWATVCIEQDNLAEADELLKQAEKISTKTNNLKQLSDVYLLLARIGIERGNHEFVDDWLQDCKAIKQRIGDHQGGALAHYRHARLYNKVEDLIQAEAYCKAAMDLLDEELHPTYIKCLLLMASVKTKEPDLVSADKYCQQAIKLSRELGTKDEIALSLYRALIVCVRTRKGDCSHYADECLHLFEQMGSQKLVALTLFETSQIHSGHHKDHETALSYCLKSLAILQKINNVHNIVIVLEQTGWLFYKLNRNDEAKEYWQRGLVLAKSPKHKLHAKLIEWLNKLEE